MGDFREENIRKAVRESVVTSLSLDAVGTVLGQLPLAERLNWLKGERASLPGGRRIVRHSVNNDLYVLILNVLTHHADEDHYEELQRAVRSYLQVVSGPRSTNRYVQYLMQNDGGDGVGMPVGVACGHYAAIMGEKDYYVRELSKTVCNALFITESEKKDAEFIAFALYRLFQAGWFCGESIVELFSANVIPSQLWNYLTELRNRHMDPKLLAGAFPAEKVEWATYTEQVCAEMLFYLARVGTAFPREILRSNPREQLKDIWEKPSAEGQDVGFLYGAFCIASEQDYQLLNRSLVNSTPRRLAVLEMLDRIS